jgi:hypothetical protein
VALVVVRATDGRRLLDGRTAVGEMAEHDKH